MAKKTVVTSLVSCLLILLVTGAIVWWINTSEPEAERETATKRSPMLVETVSVTKGNYRPQIDVLGEVMPAREISLGPQVAGEVVELGTGFEPGVIVESDELLVKIDPADYRIELTKRRSELLEAEADLSLEEGRQQVAQRELKRAGRKINSGQLSLVLREPQRKIVEARQSAAKAAVAQAELNLSRTTITAPFAAQVVERMVNIGSRVDQGDTIAHLIGIDEYWIFAKVPMGQLPWVEFATDDVEPSRALIRKRGIWGDEAEREGVVQRFIGTLDEQTRLVKVLISVADPLGRQSNKPPLILGSVVQVVIEGRLLSDVVRLSRGYLRQNDTVWIKQDGKLVIRPVEVAFRDARYAYLTSGLESGDEVVITNLSRVRDGAELRVPGETQ